MTSTPPSAGADEPSRELPPAVRARVIAWADETLAAMADDDVPAPLRAIRRFTPAKRARLGATALAAALEVETAFRAAVAERVRENLPALAAAVTEGTPTPAVPSAEVVAVAYLLDVPDWPQRAQAVQPAEPADAPAPGDQGRADRLQAQLAAARSSAREESARWREEVASARREADELRRRLSRAEVEAQRLASTQQNVQAQLEAEQQQRIVLERQLSAEARRLRQRLQDAEAAAVAARRGMRSERDAQTARMRVLLDSLSAAAGGLRRELDLPAAAARPADLVAAEENQGAESADAAGLLATLRRGRAAEDPALVDEILAVPGVHLIVDGYNVTKLGYPALTLEDQRSRLIGGLSALAARSGGAEVTCVFDATASTARSGVGSAPRGIRVLFSAPGELADQLIIRLAAAEPVGRPMVVVTNDREVIDAVRRIGAETLPSAALLGRMERA